MPRLDAERVQLWRSLARVGAQVGRRIDTALAQSQGISLAWFETLAVLAKARHGMRVHELIDALGDVPSSVSRRLDRLQEHGFVERGAPHRGSDRRAVVVRLTDLGRDAWRDALVDYRRAVQQEFAVVLTDSDLLALHRVLAKLPVPVPPSDGSAF